MPEVNFSLSKKYFKCSWQACGFHPFQALHCSLFCMKHAFGKPRKTWFNKHRIRGKAFASLTSFKMPLRHTLFQVTASFHSVLLTKLLSIWQGKCNWLNGLQNHLSPRKVSQTGKSDGAEVLLPAADKQIEAGLTVLIEDCFSYLMVPYGV